MEVNRRLMESFGSRLFLTAMILPKDQADSPKDSTSQLSSPEAGPSDPPPSFSDAIADFVVSEPPTPVASGGESPPPFEPYYPEVSTTGEALFRFLLSQSMIPPLFYLHVQGSHDERRCRTTRRNGKLETEEYNEKIVDFDFRIDLSNYILSSPENYGGPVYYSAADNEPCYRGAMVRQTRPPWGPLQKSGRRENKAFQRWQKDNHMSGTPPWISGDRAWKSTEDDSALPVAGLCNSRTIRDWADEYCKSEKLMKEFVFEKLICGWNLSAMENVIRKLVRNSLYQGGVFIHSLLFNSPDNKLSRTLSNKWLYLLLWIFLIYPFIWLFKRFHSRGGGRWEVSGAVYFMKRWVPVPSNTPEFQQITLDKNLAGAAVGSYDSTRRYVRTPEGFNKLVGVREGDWYKRWEETIRSAVRERHCSQEPLVAPADSTPWESGVLNFLDGVSE
ncbi:hypothetical protein DL96DRAFT_1575314 [Flagelloscypha sp. PMI_526]|nr:hypothetical protein DL96DRAFT_1575314 [Flagelloscypha sp. PMI_526]